MRDRHDLPARLLPSPAPKRRRFAPLRLDAVYINADRLPGPFELRAVEGELSQHFAKQRQKRQAALVNAALDRALDEPIPYVLTELALSCLKNT